MSGPFPRAPVLVCAYDRPEVTRRLFAALAAAGVPELYVSLDGPKAGDAAGAERVRAVREVVDAVDWPCSVHRLERAENVGLQAAMVSALDWFFTEVEAGIVLEDDCLPSADWFPFADELLARFAEDDRVVHVSAVNMADERRFTSHSYLFAEVGHIWGWATWRRAWAGFDPTLPVAGEPDLSTSPLRRVLARKFEAARAGRKWTWSRAWYHATLRQGGLAVIPAVNLVENVGVGAGATHRSGRSHPLRRSVRQRLAFPLDHPVELVPDPGYERLLARYHARSHLARAGDRAWRWASILSGRRSSAAAPGASGSSGGARG